MAVAAVPEAVLNAQRRFFKSVPVDLDPSSASGNSRKARDWGIPAISIEEFLSQTANS